MEPSSLRFYRWMPFHIILDLDHGNHRLDVKRPFFQLVQINPSHEPATSFDPIKESTAEAVKSLHDLGLRITMLTGDNEKTAETVADKLGIDELHAGVRPEDKHERIKALKAEGRKVAMAGDGINDAPALAEADPGIAMGTGTDVAIESSGVTLVKGDLRGIVKAVKLSRHTMRNIRQNLFFALIYNALACQLRRDCFILFRLTYFSPR